MEIDKEHGEHEEPRDGFGGERGTVVGEEYWRREDRSKWTPELGWAHTAFELGRGWGMEWSVCVGKFFDFKSAWGFLEKGVQVGRMYRPQQVAGWLSRGQKWTMPPTLGMDIRTRQTKDLWVGLWWKWWESLQPEEHTLQDNKLSYPEQASSSEMAGLHGDNGLLQVMATLVWWGEVAQKRGKAEIDDWRAAVDDVAWVLSQLLECEEVGR
jgi:hypothetical protein